MLILVLTRGELGRRAARRLAVSPWWATATLVWVCLQGAFGALTVTMKLYPAIVTLHLLGGLGLLMLLAVQARALPAAAVAACRPALRRGLGALLRAGAAAGLRSAAGSAPTTRCSRAATFRPARAQWWPQMDFGAGLHPAARARHGWPTAAILPFPALTAIHMAHRLGALVVFVADRAARLAAARRGRAPARGAGRWRCGAVAGWQLASGLGNVILGWPLAAAVAHTGGAAALVTLLAMAWRAPGRARRVEPRSGAEGRSGIPGGAGGQAP